MKLNSQALPNSEGFKANQAAHLEALAQVRAAAELAAAGIEVATPPSPETPVKLLAMEQAEGPILAYCRSGTRSTLLWALAQAQAGAAPDEIAAKAAGAGYDIAPVRATVDMLAAQAG